MPTISNSPYSCSSISSSTQKVSSSARLTEGIIFYTFEFFIPSSSAHQILQLSVSKGKIWSVDANAVGKERWAKRKDMYENVLNSFMPKLS